MQSNMEKEILEQPQILKRLLDTMVDGNKLDVNIPSKVDKVVFVASGSSYHCAEAARELFNTIGEIDCVSEYSSEFPFKKVNTSKKNLLFVFLSQSGETTDTMKVVDMVKAQGYPTMAIVNCKGSRLWNTTDYQMYCDAGPENTIASTKALSAQLLCSYLLMLKIMEQQGKNISAQLSAIQELPQAIDKVFANIPEIETAAKMLAGTNNVAVIGNQVFLAISREISLKIKETSFVNANAYPFGEFMHGHVAVMNNPGLVIAFVNNENISSQTNFLKKIKADYNPQMISFNMDNDLDVADIALKFDNSNRIIQVFAALITGQLLALNCAKALGRDIDNPHGLSKVVSVS